MNESCRRTETVDDGRRRRTDAIGACLRTWEAAGFVRPVSHSPDAYFAKLASLGRDWNADALLLSRTYAELRFGGAATDESSDEADSRLFAATGRLGAAASREALNGDDGESQRAWRAKFVGATTFLAPTQDPEPVESIVPASPAVAASAVPNEKPIVARLPFERVESLSASTTDPRPSGLRRLTTFLRRGWAERVEFRQAFAACLLFSAVSGGGGFQIREAITGSTRNEAFESQADAEIAKLKAQVEIISPPVYTGWELVHEDMPVFLREEDPQAKDRNAILANAWIGIADHYRRQGLAERTDVIYQLVTTRLPRHAEALRRYSRFLLDSDDRSRQNPEMALECAIRAYAVDAQSEANCETLIDALYATGHILRATELHQTLLNGPRDEKDYRMDLPRIAAENDRGAAAPPRT